jgi:hypothetical protein
MSAVPAARYLADFGTAAEGWPVQAAGAGLSSREHAAAKLDEAFARGLEKGRAEAHAEGEAKLQEQRNQFAEELSAARAEWAASIAEELGGRLDAALAELENRVAETTARILKPFLADGLHRQAVAELRANLESLLATDSGAAIAISGPGDVLDALREHFAGRATNVTYTPGEDCDVRVVASQATLETQLKSWLAKLDEAVP